MSTTEMKVAEPGGALSEVDKSIEQALALAESATGRIGKVVALAQATKAVATAVKDNWESLKDLKDSPLGFLTDESGRKNDFKYSDVALQTAITHGILLGGLPFNGEITVVSAKAYLGKAHYRRRISECERIANLALQFGAITMHGESRALVEAMVSWQLDGAAQSLALVKTTELDKRIPVRVNAGMGDDAILGKAERKILKRVWELSTGRQVVDGEDEDDRTVEGTTEKPSAPAVPTTEELRSAFAAFVERIRAAETADAVQAIGREFHGPKYGPFWAPSAVERFAQWVDSRLAKLIVHEPSEPGGGSGNAETPQQAFTRYEALLAEAKSVKECAHLFGAFFGDGSSVHKWSDEDRGLANEARARRVDAIRNVTP